MSDEILDTLLKEYSETYHKRVGICKSIDEQIAELQTCREIISKPYEDMLGDIKLKIQLVMNDRKSSFRNDYGKITYTKAGVRRSWDLDALDIICDSNPVVKQAILMFRKEESFGAKISIKVD